MALSSPPKLSVVPVSTSEAEAAIILRRIRLLRAVIIDAWHKRAVILDRDEQNALREEIRRTCSLLSDLEAMA